MRKSRRKGCDNNKNTVGNALRHLAWGHFFRKEFHVRIYTITDEQKEKARRTDLAGLLRSQGEILRKSGSELEWLDGTQKVTIRGNLWFHQYEQVGGDSIDFVRKFYHKSYPEAMEYLLGRSGRALSVLPPIQKPAPKFELPSANNNMRRISALKAIKSKHQSILPTKR